MLKVIFVTLLLIIEIESTSWSQCYSEYCFYSNGSFARTFDEAQLQCKNNGSKLLELKDSSAQSSFEIVVKYWMDNQQFPGLNYYVYLNLKNEKMKEMKWINNDIYKGIPGTQFENGNGYYYSIRYDFNSKTFIIRQTNFRHMLTFMCSENGCANSSCVTFPTTTSKSWFDARYECSRRNKDLAVLSWVTNFTNDLPQLIQHYSGFEFWWGLTQQLYYWQDSRSQMIYHNWLAGQSDPEFPCAVLQINPSSFVWFTANCNVPNIVICMKEQDISSTMSSSTKNIYFSTTPLNTTSLISPSTISNNMSTSDPLTKKHSTIALGVGVGVALSVLLLAAVILGTCIYFKKTFKMLPKRPTHFTNPFKKLNEQLPPSSPPTTTTTLTPFQPQHTEYATILSLKPSNSEDQHDLNSTIQYATFNFSSDKKDFIDVNPENDVDEHDLQTNIPVEYAKVNKKEVLPEHSVA